jgi:hypothetical protein
MFTIHDCLSDTIISEHEIKPEADQICESMGGKNKCFFVFESFTSKTKCDKIKESVSERGIELSLF